MGVRAFYTFYSKKNRVKDMFLKEMVVIKLYCGGKT